jgi:uncharacterized protein (TIGR03083 family)
MHRGHRARPAPIARGDGDATLYDRTVSQGQDEPIIAVLEETWSATTEACQGLPAEAWDLATDCPGWTVRDQLSHLIGTEMGLLGRDAPPLPDPMPGYVRNPVGQMNEAWIEARRGVPGDEVLAEFVDVTSRRLAELRGFAPERWDVLGWSPGGEAPYREFMRIRAFDSWVHGQDIRRAVGRPGDRFSRGEENTITRVAMAMPYVVGRKVGPPEGTTVVFEVEGPVSRRVAVRIAGKRAEVLDDPPPTPDVRITLSSEHFILLGCGREVPDQVLGSGEITFDGDEELGARIIQAMDFMI